MELVYNAELGTWVDPMRGIPAVGPTAAAVRPQRVNAMEQMLNGTGIPERAAAVNQMFNPMVALWEAGQDAQTMLDPSTSGWGKFGAMGGMLSGMAGSVLPMVAAAKFGTPAANAMEEAILGFAPKGQEFLVDEFGGLKLYHGSPHDFDKFSMDKIGTGEGAQAYGHGLYFAESEGVAKSYRDVLSGDVSTIGAMAVNTTRNPEDAIRAWEAASQGLPQDVRDAVALKLGRRLNAREILDDLDIDFYGQYNDEVAAILRSHPGRLYEVEVNANPEDFLDWDAPLSAQPEKVQQHFGYIKKPTAEEEMAALELAKRETPSGMISDHPAIVEAYRRLDGANAAEREFQYARNALQRPEAVQPLREAGIPGIKYLDAGSRGAGDGSRNYVIFDENLITIIKKYGVAGAAAMLGMSEADLMAVVEGVQE